MKINIVYTTNADAEFPCCANTEIQGKSYFGIGKTWDNAKENLMKKLKVLDQSVPEPETVDIPFANEEMDTEFTWQDGAAMDTVLAKITGIRDIEAGKV